MRRIQLFAFLLLLSPQLLWGAFFCGGHEAAIGPQYYHLRRTRGHSSDQLGSLYGVFARYARIQNRSLYLGFDARWAVGDVKGTSVRGYRIRSRIEDAKVEGQIGYAFSLPLPYCPLIALYTGYGYFRQDNHVRPPTPITCHLDTEYHYFPLGLIARIYLGCCGYLGIHFKPEFVYHAQAHIGGTSEGEENIHLDVRARVQYVVEMPLALYYKQRPCLFFTFVPFWWHRHYGGQAGFPFDFLETKERIIGLRLEFGLRF